MKGDYDTTHVCVNVAFPPLLEEFIPVTLSPSPILNLMTLLRRTSVLFDRLKVSCCFFWLSAGQDDKWHFPSHGHGKICMVTKLLCMFILQICIQLFIQSIYAKNAVCYKNADLLLHLGKGQAEEWIFYSCFQSWLI